MHTTKLKTSELKTFLELSKFIPTEKSELYPEYQYIKLEIDFGILTITKMNIKSFCIHTVSTDQDDCILFLNAEKLNSIVNQTNKEFISIIEDKNKITMKDGYYNQSFGKINNDFPVLPTLNKSYTRIDKDVIDSIGSAKVAIGKDPLFPFFMYVYLEDTYVYSGSKSSFYSKKFNKDLPKLSMTFDECSLVSLFSHIDYSVSTNFNTYCYNNTTYGFRQPEDAFGFKYMGFINGVKKDNFVCLPKEDLINFCTSSLSFVGSGFCTSTMTVYQNRVILKYEDNAKNEDNTIEVMSKLQGNDFEFHFNPAVLLPILKTLPYLEINMSDELGAVGIWNDVDSNYLGVISKMQIL